MASSSTSSPPVALQPRQNNIVEFYTKKSVVASYYDGENWQELCDSLRIPISTAKKWILIVGNASEGTDLNFEVLKRKPRRAASSQRKFSAEIMAICELELCYEPRLTLKQLKDIIHHQAGVSISQSAISRNITGVFSLKMNRFVPSRWPTRKRDAIMFKRMSLSLIKAL